MHHVDTDEIEASGMMPDLDRRALTDPLGAENLAINRYALDPGEAFSGGLHAHTGQEEVFYVIEGTATFETRPEPTAESETVTVGAGEAVRFEPGEYQQGRNESDGRVVALALGAPQETGEDRAPRPCPACGESDYLVAGTVDGEFGLECPECGETFEP